MKISVIIPVYNEAKCIEGTLENLVSNHNFFEVIVVDAGSEDQTESIASRFAKVIQSKKGRAEQMNRGAELALGDVLLFLHADTFLPPNAFDLIKNTLETTSYEAGRFYMQFDDRRWSLRFFSTYTRLRCFSYGDQALFIRKKLFNRMKGFSTQVPFEDVDFFSRLSKGKKFAVIKEPVITSARRFVSQGTWTQKWINLLLICFYYFGFDITGLKRKLYPDLR